MMDRKKTINTITDTIRDLRVSALKGQVSLETLDAKMEDLGAIAYEQARYHITQTKTRNPHVYQLNYSKIGDISDAVLELCAYYFIPTEKRAFGSVEEEKLKNYLFNLIRNTPNLERFAQSFSTLVASQMAETRLKDQSGKEVYIAAKKLKSFFLNKLSEETLDSKSEVPVLKFGFQERERIKSASSKWRAF